VSCCSSSPSILPRRRPREQPHRNPILSFQPRGRQPHTATSSGRPSMIDRCLLPCEPSSYTTPCAPPSHLLSQRRPRAGCLGASVDASPHRTPTDRARPPRRPARGLASHPFVPSSPDALFLALPFRALPPTVPHEITAYRSQKKHGMYLF
jgi:hypothetical protein